MVTIRCTHKRFFLRLGTTAAAAVFASSCATMGFGSFATLGTDFSAYRTYEWVPADTLPTGDPRLDNNAIFRDHFEGAIEQALAARGLELAAPDETPDLLVHYHASVTRRFVAAVATDRSPREHAPFEPGMRLDEYELGTFVVDLVDGRTRRLVWRGWAEDSIEGWLAEQDVMARRIDVAVTGMMKRLPPLVPAR